MYNLNHTITPGNDKSQSIPFQPLQFSSWSEYTPEGTRISGTVYGHVGFNIDFSKSMSAKRRDYVAHNSGSIFTSKFEAVSPYGLN